MGGEPLAYFLTWPTYGTWLPGDARGCVKKNAGQQLPDPKVEKAAAGRMKEDAVLLNARQRALVEKTIQEHCQIRNWTLHSVNCRSNHVHVVVSAPVHPNIIVRELKAWCTRRLKELASQTRSASEGNQAGSTRHHCWAEGASKRYFNKDDDLESAIIYVNDAQDEPIR